MLLACYYVNLNLKIRYQVTTLDYVVQIRKLFQ